MQKNLRGGKKREKKIAIYYYLLYYEIMEGEVIQDIKPVEIDYQKLPIKPRRKSKSADIIKLKLRNKELTTREIGKLTGTSHENVIQTLQRYKIDTKQLTGFKKTRADIMAGIQDNILSTINDDIINKSSLKDRIISASILYDKERLETGKSTQNIAMSKVVELIDKESSIQE